MQTLSISHKCALARSETRLQLLARLRRAQPCASVLVHVLVAPTEWDGRAQRADAHSGGPNERAQSVGVAGR